MTIIGYLEKVAKALDIIREVGPGLGLELNIHKKEIFWPSYDGSKLHCGLFPSDIGRLVLGLKLLGGAVSRDGGFIKGLSMKRVAKVIYLIHTLPQLRYPQSEHLFHFDKDL